VKIEKFRLKIEKFRFSEFSEFLTENRKVSIFRMTAPLEYVTKPVSCAPFNFGPASRRDAIVHTCERPGADDAYDTPRGIPQAAVQEWVEFMRARDVKRVVTLLDDNELEYFAVPLFETYQKEGFTFTHVPMGGAEAKVERYDLLLCYCGPYV
jgi:hypothetical protein